MGSILGKFRLIVGNLKSLMASGYPGVLSQESKLPNAFSIGDLVALVGLNKAEFNQHVGKVCGELENGRHGVRLQSEQRLFQVMEEDDKPPIALKPENLRLISYTPSKEPISVVDTVGPKTIFMLLGERGWGLLDN